MLLFGEGSGLSAHFGSEWLLIGAIATVAFGIIGALRLAGSAEARELHGHDFVRNNSRRHRGLEVLA